MAELNPGWSRKTIDQIPSQGQLVTLLTPAFKEVVESYAPPMTRTINGHTLEGDIRLTAEDVGARSNTWLPTPAEIDAQPVQKNATKDNFAAFNANGVLVDSGKNSNSFLPAKYTVNDASKVLSVDSKGYVQATDQSELVNFIPPYDPLKPYRENEVFYSEDPNEGLGIFTTIKAHNANSFNADQNKLIAKVGLPNKSVQPTLVKPTSNANYTLSGTLAQILQGLLNNIKNAQDRIARLEEECVRTDTPKVKVNVSSTASTAQQGYYIIRIDPADVLK